MLLLIFAVVYLFSTGAHAYSVDEITNYASARFLVEYGSPDLRIDDPFPSGQLMKATHTDDERVSSRYGLVAWLPLVPLYALASTVGPSPEPPSPTFPETSHVLPLVVLLFNPMVAAGLIASIYILARQIGLRGRYAICAAVIAGVGSPLWVYSKTLSSVPLASIFMVGAVCGASPERVAADLWPVAVSGLAGGPGGGGPPRIRCPGDCASTHPYIHVEGRNWPLDSGGTCLDSLVARGGRSGRRAVQPV